MKKIILGAALLSTVSASASMKIDCNRPSVKGFGFSVELIQTPPRFPQYFGDAADLNAWTAKRKALGNFQYYTISGSGQKSIYKNVNFSGPYRGNPMLDSQAWFSTDGQTLEVVGHDVKGDADIPVVKFWMKGKITSEQTIKPERLARKGEIIRKGYIGSGNFTYEPKGAWYGKSGKLYIYSCSFIQTKD